MATLVQQVDNAVYVEPLIKESLENIKARIIQQMGANRRNASGRSVASLRVETTGVDGVLWGSKSFLAMERGRKGGRIPHGFTSIIAKWIQDKGISVTTDVRTVAYSIAKKIAKEGTQLHRLGIQQDIYSKAIEDEYHKLAEKLGVRFGSTINYINQQYAAT